MILLCLSAESQRNELEIFIHKEMPVTLWTKTLFFPASVPGTGFYFIWWHELDR